MRAHNSSAEPPEVDLTERLRHLAVVAADLVVPGMLVGLGSGSTAEAVIHELGLRVAEGLVFTGVPTSVRTAALARDLSIPLTTLDEVDRLDLGIDGADEIDPQLDAIKGRGGALLCEKLVALAATTTFWWRPRRKASTGSGNAPHFRSRSSSSGGRRPRNGCRISGLIRSGAPPLAIRTSR